MIWCVEDDASIRDIEVYALQSTGFEAEGFSDGAEFWEAVQKERPELVVLDVMLPGIDGIELLRRMKARAELRDVRRTLERRVAAARAALLMLRDARGSVGIPRCRVHRRDIVKRAPKLRVQTLRKLLRIF